MLAHNLDRPIGVMVTHAQGDAGFSGVFTVDATPDGDTALVQAKSGSRRGLSAGVDVLESHPGEDGRLVVDRGELAETSQVTLAAYSQAGISMVAAKDEGEKMEPSTEAATPEQPTGERESEARKHEEASERRSAPVIVTGERDAPKMRLGEFVQTIIRAEKGDRAAGQRIEAALTSEGLTANPGVVPIAYVSQILDALEHPRTLFNAFSHADLPPAGMTVRRPEVTSRPNSSGWVVDDLGGMPSGPITLGNHDTPVEQWAYGVSASVALVERSSPSYTEEAFKQMLAAYYDAVEQKIAAELEAITAPATTPPTTLGGAASLYMRAYGEWPTLLVAGGDAFGKIVDATGILMFATGTADLQGNANIAGLRVVAGGKLTAPADVWLCDADLLESRESSPVRLSVSNVSALSLELGVTSFYSLANLAQTFGGVSGAVRIDGYTPPAVQAAASSGGGRSK